MYYMLTDVAKYVCMYNTYMSSRFYWLVSCTERLDIHLYHKLLYFNLCMLSISCRVLVTVS